MEKRTLTIEEMIAAGASWADITTRVRELQRKQAEKEHAEKMAQAEKAKRAEVATAARERLVKAFADWGIAEGFITEEGKEDFMEYIVEAINATLEDLRHAMLIKKIFGRR